MENKQVIVDVVNAGFSVQKTLPDKNKTHNSVWIFKSKTNKQLKDKKQLQYVVMTFDDKADIQPSVAQYYKVEDAVEKFLELTGNNNE